MKKLYLLLVIPIFLFPVITEGVAFSEDKLILFDNGKQITDNSVIITQGIYTKVAERGIYLSSQAFDKNIILYKTNNTNLLNYAQWHDDALLGDKNCAGYITQKSEWEKAKAEFEKNKSSLHQDIQKRVASAQTREERGRIWDEWNNIVKEYMHSLGFTFYLNTECYRYDTNMHDNYLKENILKASYSKSVVIPSPEDNEVYGAIGMNPSGIVGTPRTFKVDIIKGTIEEASPVLLKKTGETIFISFFRFLTSLFRL